MQNIIIVNGVRQSGVTTKAKELKEKIEGLGLGYKVAITNHLQNIIIQGSKIYINVRNVGINYTYYDYIIIDRFNNDKVVNFLKEIASVKIINLEESDIIMRMIGKDLSEENVKKQIKCYLDFKKDYVNTLKRWD